MHYRKCPTARRIVALLYTLAATYYCTCSAAPIHHESEFSQHYLVDYKTMDLQRQPIYHRFETIESLQSSQHTIPSENYTKRDGIASKQTQTIQTASFKIILDCTAPFGEPTNTTDAVGPTCRSVAMTLERAAMRLQQALFLRTPVTVNVTFKSLCIADGDTNIGKSCSLTDDTLGYAAPAAWHVFTPKAATSYRLDYNYSYPSSLAKQYAPMDPAFAPNAIDIMVVLNSDVNWWFASDTDPLGESDSGKWGAYHTTSGGFYGSGSKSYDFEQTAVHEFCHGLGFVSSWAPWLNDTLFLPSFIESDASGNAIGVAPAFIFSRWMSDTFNSVWLRTYSDIIRQSVKDAIAQAGQEEWPTAFNNSMGGQISRALSGPGGLFQTPGAVAAWYPDVDRTATSTNIDSSSSSSGSNIVYKYAVLYTPISYSGGSSLSHVDGTTYAGTSNLLMRPAGTPGIGLDFILPSTSKGPIGEVTLGIFRSMGYVTI
ncbi:hypothetical protein BASA50_006854 [Batrachochytrium salamandrivorans]|uniref:Peptidase M43 pregnancy-associated plasma-A domain-containing protein n=1 Tax=Batrachochytrium salamandrivorans TaxID=1357716 RepID=A0ABQ8F8Q2_9FUNG|nr:hypothetical protein BASA50_006854 [Batrachochytrium salamandrivorans]KAH6601681.1 hypothetical protein BASA61_001885 [Batrachochytrium salamandrivorans]